MMTDNAIKISSHYYLRFRERVAKTKRVEWFAKEAYVNGRTGKDIRNAQFRNYLCRIENKYRHVCAIFIYKGYIHIYDAFTGTAITVFRVPNVYRKYI